MTRIIIQHTEGFRIFINIFRKGKKSKIIEYVHNLGAIRKAIYEEKSFGVFNYIAKNHKERVQKNKELIKKMKRMEA